MSAKLKHQQGSGDNVIPLSKCKEESCIKKSERMDFCTEHYAWFKFGLITKEGAHPTDFDRKLQAFKKHNKAA